MTQEEFITELEDILSLDEGELTPNSNLKEIEDWDSLAVISVIALVDKKIGKKMDVLSIKECVSVSDLINVVGL
jgi:acyl carrier protein